MDKKIFKILGILFCFLALLLTVLVILLPILKKNTAMDDSSNKSIPKIENTHLWAEFPGEIKSKTIHNFQILEYSNDLTKSTIKDSLNLIEEVKYDNFEYVDNEDKMYFDAKSEFKFLNEKSKNEKITTLSLGLFETLETISNPATYQKGINSIQYLFNKAFQSPDSFIRHLFSYDYFKNLQDETLVRSTILKDVEVSKADKILNPDSIYSFKRVSGFYQWVKILGNPFEITKANWLKDDYYLTSEEINSVLGENQFLYNKYLEYNKELAKKYKCRDENFCGYDIIYTQLISGKVIKDANLDNLYSLYQQINKEYYPFSKSPELNLYFEEYKKKINREDIKYEDYLVNETQLDIIIGPQSQFSILSANNSVLFLSLIQVEDTQTLSQIYELSIEKAKFLCDYFYEFLPKLFLYQDFQEDGKTYTINPTAKAFSIIAQNIMGETYYKLSNSKGLYNLLLSKLVWRGLHYKLLNFSMEYEDEDICPLIMQHALDDGRKVLKICSDPQTSFNSPYTLSKWFAPYYCVKSGDESKCDMTIINHLKSIVYITEEEIKAIYSKDFLGDLIEENDKALKEAYNCQEECDNDYLAKMQFWKSYVTLNVPPGLEKCDTISKLFPDEFPYPLELYYYAQKYSSEEIAESDVDYLISLSPKGNNLLNEDSYEAFNNRLDLEKKYTLYIESKKNDDESKYKVINLFSNGYLYDNRVNNTYENINNLLQGNNLEDQRYIRYLANGNYYDNFKPGLNATTGFNFGFNFETGEKIYVEYDRYAINTKEDKLRKIVSINNCPILNIKKKEYNYLSNSYSNINSPILNFQSLTEEKSFIDGFQYSHDQDTIYYYDKISSRPFKFTFSEEVDYSDQVCRKYNLDKSDLTNDINEKDDLNTNKAFISQKLNKPFIITAGKDELNDEIKESVSDENYICVEPFSNMVIESKINFVYSIYTKQYGYIYSKIENEKTYPIFIYSKNYEVDIDSFNDAFPDIKSYREFRNIFIIVGVILIVLLTIASLVCFYYGYKAKKRIDISPLNDSNNKSQALINDSRDPTTNKTNNEDKEDN